jgi:hypothetical protein
MNYLIFRRNNEYDQGTLDDHLEHVSNHGETPDFWSSSNDLLSALQEAKMEHERSQDAMVVYDSLRNVIVETYAKKPDLSQSPVNGSLPTEEQVLQTIFDCVFIRGIELENYKYNFTNEQSGLYDALVKLFGCNNQ